MYLNIIHASLDEDSTSCHEQLKLKLKLQCFMLYKQVKGIMEVTGMIRLDTFQRIMRGT